MVGRRSSDWLNGVNIILILIALSCVYDDGFLYSRLGKIRCVHGLIRWDYVFTDYGKIEDLEGNSDDFIADIQ